ncbi:MAG: alcohol dehydrogenase catalytic domain-containing protein [Chloroflexi bacterium]|nr:alcohol dehydrogenase catalytic domain-containing protein [Chloroflexota bacterium]
MSDKLAEYRRGETPIPEKDRLWPLYGAGLENMGVEAKPITVETPTYGPDELLVRHDACGLCFSDIKVITLGEKHPRIFRDIKKEPIVLGHEVVMTVVGVGENLKDKYKLGDRFIIQADIYVKGVNYAYGYMIQGGLSQYAVIDQRILNGDDGNYLIPIQEKTGYAESALVEPWACVIAAYELKYRTALKAGGTTWIIGTTSAPREQPLTIGAGFSNESHPNRLLLSNVPDGFSDWLKAQAQKLGIEVVEVADISSPPADKIDDIVILGSDADVVEMVSPKLADHGIVAIISTTPFERKVNIDVGRIHYNDWVYVGGHGPDIARAYSDVPVRSTLKPGGSVWFAGAGGPIGRMHVQRAIEHANGPSAIVCTDVSDARLDDLCVTFGEEARAKGINFVCLNPMKKDEYAAGMAQFKAGFDDVVVLAPIPPVIADCATHLAPQGIMNVFAGVARGTTAALDLTDVFARQTRVIGHTASTIDDMRLMLQETESGELSTNRSVAAIGSLEAARDGMQALKDTTYPGKVVIYPNIKYMPLTALSELQEKMPTVYARLKNGREWTVEAEEEFLRLMLP